jgi:hypothetical protein
MKKLKLELDDLRVETFETVKTAYRRGTVVGQDGTSAGGPLNCQDTCVGGGWTEDLACMPTRDLTCQCPTEEWTCMCLSNEWACAPTGECGTNEATCAAPGC